MNEEVKKRIFDHSFTTKSASKKTGLGLAIAQQNILEKHGDSTYVNSTLEKTEFIIILPIKVKSIYFL